MSRPGILVVACALAAFGNAAPPGAAAQEASIARPGRKAVVERVQWEISDTGVQLVVLIDGQASYSTHAASADVGARLPPRAYVDLRPAQLGREISRRPIAVGDGLLQRIRIAQFDRETVRIVVDLSEPALFDVRTIEGPARLVLSLRPPPEPLRSRLAGGVAAPRPSPALPELTVPTPAALAAATATPPEPPRRTAGPAPSPAPSPAAEARVARRGDKPKFPPPPRVRTVVIDPGHGGRDPGARGVTGDEEKVITLAIAELVAEMLRPDEHLRIALTRTDDHHVSLEQRTAIANAEGADLFVSIHANASDNPLLAGIETYTLNNTDDRATIRLAALENGLTLAGAAPGERDLAYILSDLLQTGKEDESVSLARAVHGDVISYLQPRWKGVTSLGVKKGPFYVLVGAYMPCILIEVAFLTNEVEGQRIAARRYQRDVAEGVARGIRRFLASDTANANL